MFINLNSEQKAERIAQMLVLRKELRNLQETRNKISKEIDNLNYQMNNLVPNPEDFDEQGKPISRNYAYCNCKHPYPGCCSFSEKD